MPEQAYLGGRILNIPVPHTGHTPFKAGLPLAIFTCWALEIFLLALHFTQYPSSAAIGAFPAFAIALLRSGAGQGGGVHGLGVWGGSPGSPPRDGDNIIRCAQTVGAEICGGASENPFRL